MQKELQGQILNSFKGLHFEPVRHVYTLDGKNLASVSSVVEEFGNKFDTEGKAKGCAIKYGGTPEEYKEKWAKSSQVACDLGHRVHAFGEKYFYNRKIKPSDGFEVALVKFWQDLPDFILPLLSESRVFTRNYQYAGTFDNLFYHMEKKGLIITDYKTNKDIYKNFQGQTMLSPFDDLLDTPFNHYQVQTSLYQIPFEDIGFKVLDRYIIWLKPDGTYERIKTRNYTKELRAILN